MLAIAPILTYFIMTCIILGKEDSTKTTVNSITKEVAVNKNTAKNAGITLVKFE